MIRGIGNDIIEIDRVAKAIQNKRFISKYFSNKEIEMFNVRKNNVETIAGNFAVKEAVSKVLGTGFRGINIKDIEVLRDEYGKPYVNLKNTAQIIKEDLKINSIHVSISHCKNYVSAVAIGE